MFFGAYLLRLNATTPHYNEGDSVRLSGYISSDPQLYDRQLRLQVGDFSLFTPYPPEFSYGDRVSVEGTVHKGEYGLELKNPKNLQLLEKSLPLSGLRQKILENYRALLPETHVALLAGITLGAKSNLDKDFFETLKRTSTLHVVVASGTNVSIVGGAILAMLAPYVGRKKALVASLAAITLYTLMVGLQPPIVRAAIMGTIGFTALALGRESNALRALFAASATMLLIWPQWLFDLGFQLSFLATFGVIVFSPVILRGLGSAKP